MLFFGGGGGLINMSYGMNAMIHNTSWVTAHFHLIFGGTVVIMYFAIAYAIWPSLAGRDFASAKPLRLQLWLWFVGMMVMTLPWHWTGLQGQWRRIAAFDYSDPLVASWGPWVIVSLAGGIVLTISALLFVWNLMALHRSSSSRMDGIEVHYAQAVHPPARLPSSLNGFGLWNLLVAVLMLLAYGYPIAQFFVDPRRKQ
jgi:cytochrome c oxidase subunit 1